MKLFKNSFGKRLLGVFVISTMLFVVSANTVLAASGDTPPVVANVAIEPGAPLDTDDLIVSYDYFDADGDLEGATEIRWFKKGLGDADFVAQPAYDDQLIVPAADTNVDDEWTVTVTPHSAFPEIGENGSSAAVTVIEVVEEPENTEPIFTPLDDQSVNEGAELTFQISATDEQNDPLTLSLVSIAPDTNGTAFVDNGDNTGDFSWTPTFDQSGVYTVTFQVTDGALTVSEEVIITVNNVNRAPELDPIGNKSVDEEVELAFVVAAVDPDGDDVVLSSSELPEGATFTPENGQFLWTPTTEQVGNYEVTFTATDSNAAATTETITISVGDVNHPPVLDAIAAAQTVNEGEKITFTVSATDPDGGTPALSSSELPEGASFDVEDGEFSWIAGFTQSGVYEITFTATDGGELQDSETTTITVVDVNGPPVIVPIGDKDATATNELSFAVAASDPDEDAITLSAENLPEGAAFNVETGVFTWTPTELQVGDFEDIIFTAAAGAHTSSETITIHVTAVGAPVFIGLTNETINEHQALTIEVTAEDPEEEPVTYTASNLPEGAAFDAETHTFTWTPNGVQSGVYSVTFSATSGEPALTTTRTITITVDDTDQGPTFNAVPVINLPVDATVHATIFATDPNEGDVVTITSGELPAGAFYSPEIGSFVFYTTKTGTYSITFTATSGENPAQSSSVTQTIILTASPSTGGGSAFPLPPPSNSGSSNPAPTPPVILTPTSPVAANPNGGATNPGPNGNPLATNPPSTTSSTDIGQGGLSDTTPTLEVTPVGGPDVTIQSTPVVATVTPGDTPPTVEEDTDELSANDLAANTLGVEGEGNGFDFYDFLIGGGFALGVAILVYLYRRWKKTQQPTDPQA